MRQNSAKTIFDLEDRLKQQLLEKYEKTNLAEAIRYALGRVPKARPYLEEGQL